MNTYRIARRSGNKSLMASISLKQMQMMNMPKPSGLIFDKNEIETFVPIKQPTIKVRTFQKQKRKQNVESMLRVYCNSRLLSPKPNSDQQLTTYPHLRPQCNTKMADYKITATTGKVNENQEGYSHEPLIRPSQPFVPGQPSIAENDK